MIGIGSQCMSGVGSVSVIGSQCMSGIWMGSTRGTGIGAGVGAGIGMHAVDSDSFAHVGYAVRVVEVLGTLLDQTVVLYGGFVCGLSVCVGWVMREWIRRGGATHSWA